MASMKVTWRWALLVLLVVPSVFLLRDVYCVLLTTSWISTSAAWLNVLAAFTRIRWLGSALPVPLTVSLVTPNRTVLLVVLQILEPSNQTVVSLQMDTTITSSKSVRNVLPFVPLALQCLSARAAFLATIFEMTASATLLVWLLPLLITPLWLAILVLLLAQCASTLLTAQCVEVEITWELITCATLAV